MFIEFVEADKGSLEPILKVESDFVPIVGDTVEIDRKTYKVVYRHIRVSIFTAVLGLTKSL